MGSPDINAGTAKREDHRVRVAREKRERMRAHLIRSVRAVCSTDMSGGPKVIDDVVRHARVSRGTFYKHFTSMEAAIEAVGAELVEEMTIGIYPVYNVLTDPRERFATGFQLFLKRASFDHHWGGFVAHLGMLDPSNDMIRHIEGDIRLGMDEGHYKLASVNLGVDIIVGTMTATIRRIIRGETSGGYIEEIAALVLRAFGETPANAAATVAAMSRRLEATAPEILSWWPSYEGALPADSR